MVWPPFGALIGRFVWISDGACRTRTLAHCSYLGKDRQAIARWHIGFRPAKASMVSPEGTLRFRSGQAENNDFREPARSVLKLHERRKRRKSPFAGRHHLNIDIPIRRYAR